MKMVMSINMRQTGQDHAQNLECTVEKGGLPKRSRLRDQKHTQMYEFLIKVTGLEKGSHFSNHGVHQNHWELFKLKTSLDSMLEE